jgi:uncharacterized protein (DUF983 family)
MTNPYADHRVAGEPWQLGLAGRCPRCGEGHLFAGYLTLAPKCDVCGLDYSFADPADGPAFFAICLWAVPITAFALWFQFAHEPAVWVQVLVTGSLLIGGCLALLRPLKGWLVCSQYIYKAEEGRLVSDPPQDR